MSVWEDFRREVNAAAENNMRWLLAPGTDELKERVRAAASHPRITPAQAASRACEALHAMTGYGFNPRLPVCAGPECVRRRMSACGDFAGLAAAMAILRGADSVQACIRTDPSRPGYAHVVAIVDGQEIDPVAHEALPPGSFCASRWSILDDLRK